MAQPRTHRFSNQYPGTPRSQSSPSLASASPLIRPRRININLPKHAATAAAFQPSAAAVRSLDRIQEDRVRYSESVLKHAASEALMKMPNIATKSRSVDDIFELQSTAVSCKLPSTAPTPHSNLKVSMDSVGCLSSLSPSFTSQRPGMDRKQSSHRAGALGHTNSRTMAADSDKDEADAKRSNMNPLAATFTPTFPKPTLSDCAPSDHGGETRCGTTDFRDPLIAGLGISSPGMEYFPHQRYQYQNQQHQALNTETFSSFSSSSTRQDSSTIVKALPTTISSATVTAIPTSSTTTTAVEFDPEEFRISLMRQITDKLETGLDRHFSQLVSATTSLPLSPTHLDQVAGSSASMSTVGSSAPANYPADETTVLYLKKLLRNANAELERLKDKNQELRETNHKLELQHLEIAHQVTRLQDFELNNQFLLSRLKELEGSSNSSLESALETASMNGYRQRASYIYQGNNFAQQNQQIQNLMAEITALTQERDAFKIRSWELEKKPFSQQHQQDIRSAHFIDLENERNRLIEELGQKTVAMEDLWNKNEALMVRAKEYEKRVWELEGQVATLEAECASLPRIRLELVEMEARADAADALLGKLQDMEGQVSLVKSLQERIHELETTNAELDHSNWDLSEKLNIANNQHTLLTKEFESFRSKDKDDRRLEFLANRNRELEALLAEQAKGSPDYKEEYERVSLELEKLKIRMPQLEGQAKQVTLLRSKTQQLEKQIKAMEGLEPRLGEMQQLHERNMFLESELGELEQLRAREMELEHELEESKARLAQLETNKTRMNSFSAFRQLQTRARSGSVAQHSVPFIPLQPQQPQQPQQAQGLQQRDNDESGGNGGDLRVRTTGGMPHSRPSQSISSVDAMLSPRSPKREFLPATMMSVSTPTTATWPSGRSSMSMSNASNRMSTSSSTSTALSSGSGSSASIQQLRVLQQTCSVPVSPEESSDEVDEADDNAKETQTAKLTEMSVEPESFLIDAAKVSIVSDVMLGVVA
ncbi:hypothetical protein BC939DRAFT_452292 [Gamsiella multidivaricata]|uniref:uncharacterized protein n=1 Tax=Gamsiella multidivaricata TaxID=101098 RepID=UPI00221E9368|nr:uncharacterized protein BC939DRAFT_452292 [Gamsiella multidivaricata]KAG0359996.1 hypothetical protein BGZ54_009740 [Gamsiella multidivaricata]KAI7823260.1 hypothetical protein BC939DRAFT_452292 [Gamsiella multidivaricata]